MDHRLEISISVFIDYNQLQSMPLNITRPIDHCIQQPRQFAKIKSEQAQSPASEQNSLSQDDSLHLSGKEINEGRWNEDQNFKFVVFVHYYQDIFASKHKRKVSKIFRTFASYLTGRTAAQCRSHYQKMILKHKTVPKLKKYYRQYFGEERYKEELQTFTSIWESNPHNIPKTVTEVKEVKQFGIQTEKQEPQRIPCTTCWSPMAIQPLESSSNQYIYWPDYSSNNQFPQMSNLNYYYWIVPENSLAQL